MRHGRDDELTAQAPSAPTASVPVPPEATPAAPAIAPPPPASAPPAAPSAAPIDEKVIATATGVEKPDNANGIIKVSFPRKDVAVAVDSWKLPPFMGLTSWAAFSPGTPGKSEAMVMGDLVLFEDEVNPVISTLLDNGVEVTALHNHFFYDSPHVFFMHVGGEGGTAALGKGIRAAIDKTAEIERRRRSRRRRITTSFPKSTIDASKIEAAFGVKGQAKDGMFKAVMGREIALLAAAPSAKRWA